MAGLEALAAPLLGGGINYFGNLLGKDQFGSSSASESAGIKGMEYGLDAALGAAPALTQASMYNEAGQTGPAVRQGFETALGGLTNSMSAIASANAQNAAGDRALSNVGTTTSIARQVAENNLRNARTNITDTARLSGMPASALTAAASAAGRSGAQGALALGGQSTAAAAQANQMAAQGAAGAQNTLGQDLSLRNQIYVDPYKAQLNQGVAGLAGKLAGDSSSSMQSTSDDYMFNNPFQTVGSYFNSMSGMQLAKDFKDGTGLFKTGDNPQKMQ